ncbi:MAG TPA: tetratricopeptide repeat protein [Anaeromyxobacteraceae bacterium]|nr:tetratricopeptide repeat protein [Anaeromyxobacteraceae bacterium]
MNFRFSAAVLAVSLLLAPALAAAQDQSLIFAQADFREPASPEEAIDSKINADATELALLKDVYVHVDRAMRDRLSGKYESATAEDKVAADNLMGFVNKYPSHRLRIVFLRMASGRYLNAKMWEAAAEAAQRMVQDPKAQPVTKAIGARYASGGWQMLAVEEMRSGKIPSLKLQPSTARGGAAPQPRVPDRAWRMFVENADIYTANYEADPTSKLTAEERKVQGGADLGQLQLIAAQVEFGYDNIEDAQKRFGKVIETHPSRADLLESAVPYYLDTYRILKDPKGLEAAAARIEPIVAAEARKATEAAAAPGATEEQKKTAATLTRLAKELKEGSRGGEAAPALEAMAKADAAAKDGKTDAASLYRDAAALFEKAAKDNPSSPDVATYLFNAGIAYDKAKDPKKAIAVREEIVKRFPDAKVAPQTYLLLGNNLAAVSDYAGLARLANDYLARWPDSQQRCLVLENLGIASEKTKKLADAGAAYLRFSTDDACVGQDANLKGKYLYRAGIAFEEAKKPAESQKALNELVAMKGITDPVVKSYQDDAKKRLAKGKKK